MSSEQNVSEVPSHQPPPPSNQGGDSASNMANPGSGQSKSSRRRRRKRKGRGPEEMAGSEGSGGGEGVIPAMQAQSTPNSAAGAQGTREGSPQNMGSQNMASQNSGSQNSASPNSGFQNGNAQGNGGQGGFQNGNGQGGFGARDQAAGGKRWKKRFRDRDRPQRSGSNENPGNQASPQPSAANNGSGGGFGGGFASGSASSRDTNTHQFGNRSDGFKRKGPSSGGKQRERGPRSFVGPMDHSYRAAASSDGASTVEGFLGGWSRTAHKGDSQPIDYSQGRPVPIAEDAPTRIYFFIEDLFFYAKINETARKLGVKIAFIKSDKESLAELLALEEDGRPGLIVFDLNNANAKPLTLIPKIKTKFKRQTSIIGFLSHLQGDLKAKAVEAGCDTVMPRAAFSQNLPNLLRRYGIEEEHEEANFNA